MDCGTQAFTLDGAVEKGGYTTPPGKRNSMSRQRKISSSEKRVEFVEKGEVKEKREKYLTAKYGAHQMCLIRKRLAVEMWMYDELQALYGSDVSCTRSQHQSATYTNFACK